VVAQFAMRTFAVLISLSVIACAAAPDLDPDAAAPAAPAVEPPSNPDGAVFTQTEVWLSADGTSRVETRPITRDEERAIAARISGAQPLIWQDVSCGASFWLYDQPYYAGNRICFHGAGTAALALYPREVNGHWYTWQISSGSWYDAYNASGVLTPLPQPPGRSDASDSIYFAPYMYSPQFGLQSPLMTILLNG
jgi:hypothetical protein